MSWQLRPGAPRHLSLDEKSAYEASLARHRTALFVVVDQLNSAIYALALPDELLVDIFQQYITARREMIHRDAYETMDTQSTRPNVLRETNAEVYGWTILTHVCRRWRQVVLQNPSFWTRIRVSTPQLVRTYLERSGSMALDVDGTLIVAPRMNRDTIEAWRLVFGQAHRIRTLQLSYSFVEREKAPEQVIRQIQFGDPCLPNLKSLSLHLDNTYVWDRALPPMVTALKSQCTLETLQAYNVHFHTIRELFTPHLLHLELHNIDGGCTTVDKLRSRWEATLTALKALPRLKILKLISSLPFHYHAAPPTLYAIDELPIYLDEPVNLPHLSLLQTSSRYPLTPAVTLLRHLSYPTLTPLVMHMESSPEMNLRMLGSTLAAKAQAAENALPSLPLRTLSIRSRKIDLKNTVMAHYPIRLTAWTERLPFSPEPGASFSLPPYAHDSFLLEARILNAAQESVFFYTIPSLPMESVECLHLTLYDRDNAEEPLGLVMRDAFAQAGKVDTLVIYQASGLDWLPDVLWPPEHDPAAFPKLGTLHLSEVTFLPLGSDDDWDQPRTERRSQWWENLETALRFRKEDGINLKKIVIVKSRNIYQDDIDMLRNYAHEVIWDGRTGDEEKAGHWAWAESDCEMSG